MKTARYLDSETNNWMSVHISEYDREVHGTNLRCGDPHCNAEMYFSPEHKAHGDSITVSASFKSKSRKDHITSCVALQMDDLERESFTIAQALEQNLPIMLNMNFSLGHPNAELYGGNHKNIGNLDTPYNNWRRENRHGTDRAKTIDEYLSLISKVSSRNREALKQTFIGHAQQMMAYTDFHIDDKFNNAGLIDVYRELKQQSFSLNGSGDVVHGFPRLFTFKHTKKAAKGLSSRSLEIQGNPATLAHDKNGKLILLNTLLLNDQSLRAKLMTHNAYDVIATPVFVRKEFQQSVRKCKAGQTAFVNQKWVINSADQFKPAIGSRQLRSLEQPDMFENTDRQVRL